MEETNAQTFGEKKRKHKDGVFFCEKEHGAKKMKKNEGKSPFVPNPKRKRGRQKYYGKQKARLVNEPPKDKMENRK